MSESCIRCGGALVDSGIFCPKCRADGDASEVAQLQERNERLSSVAHNASHELETLQRKYRLLENDRNALLQQLRERDAHIALLERSENRAHHAQPPTRGKRP